MSVLRRLAEARWAAPLLWLALVCAGGVYLHYALRLSTALSVFMPPGHTAEQRLMLEEMQDSPAARAILIAIDGGTAAERAAASRAYAGRLRQSGLFAQVANGELHLDPAEERQLFGWRYLLSPAVDAQAFTVTKLHADLQMRLAELGTPLGMLEKRFLPADPTGAFLAMLSAWQPAQAPERRNGVWVSPDGERALLLAETRAPGLDLGAMQQAIGALHSSFAAVNAAGRLHLILSGPPVFAVQSRDTIKSDSQWFSSLASVALVLLLLAVYRSFRLVLLSALPLGSAVLAGVVAVNAVFGEIHGITLAFGATLLGVAIDYPLHLFSHLSGGESPSTSLRRIWPTLRLGVLTTMAGYLALLGTGFVGLGQLGTFAIAGLAAAAGFTRWVLPRLIPQGFEPVRRTVLLEHMAERIRPRPVAMLLLLALVLLSAMVLWQHRDRIWEDNLSALSPIPPASLALDQRLRADLDAAEVSHLVVVQGATAEQVLQRSQVLGRALREGPIRDGWLRGFDMAARYLPDAATQRARQAALPDAETLRRRMDQALAGLPFRAGLFQPFIEAVQQARRQSPVTPAEAKGTLLGARIGSLLYTHNGEWVALVPLIGVKAPQPLSDWFASQHFKNVSYLDMRAQSTGLMQAFRHRALQQLLLAAVIILLVLTVGLRGIRFVFVVIGPLFLALLLDVTVLVAAGEHLSIFHLVSLLLVAGISMDYALFFSHREPDRAARAATLHALSLCAISTVLVFAILAVSSLPVLRAIGLTAAVGVGSAYLLAMLLAQRRPRAET
ncbi:MAG: MMPL family transporter [Gammaproteobacteria bacterium]